MINANHDGRTLEGRLYQDIRDVWRDLMVYRDTPDAVKQIVRNASIDRWVIDRGGP